MATDMDTLMFALEKYPERVSAIPVERLLMDSARKNAKRPAYVKLAVPDELVKALRGSAERNDMVLLVSVPREIETRANSRIVLPNEVR
ncbi:MAG: hypothetical protein IH936_00465 [Acidobacteria bacterium]|nr:hypothetical protein [Acidobacteriota bacterium]